MSHVKQLLQQTNAELLEKVTIRQPPGVMTFRYWQDGSGFDRNLEYLDAIEVCSARPLI